MNLETYKQRLLEVKKQLDNKEIDEIPLDARPKMLDFDFDKDSYVIVSYSRKDFVEVYQFLAHLYNEGYRFWYDNGMKGSVKWLEEYKAKFENSNCLGTITFFSDNYISDSTKEELEIIYNENGYVKKNVVVSLVSLKDLDPNKLLINAMSSGRMSIENAAGIKPVLTELIAAEKEKTIHRYMSESDIQPLAEKIGKDFAIRIAQKEKTTETSSFIVNDGVLLRYLGNDKGVVIPDSVKIIGPDAFQSCDSLSGITVPEGVTAICNDAFYGCTSLVSITLPSGLEIVDNSVFSKCTSLVSITLQDCVTKIGARAFDECKSLSSITIPDSVTSIGEYAFYGCTSLSCIMLPNSITKISGYTFYDCSSLTSVMLPDSVTCIGEGAFGKCISLTDISLPSSVKSIGDGIFAFCPSLTHVTIPDSVRSIGDKVFHCCEALIEITFEGTKSQWELIAKKDGWHDGTIKYVKCTDGIIELTAEKEEKIIDDLNISIEQCQKEQKEKGFYIQRKKLLAYTGNDSSVIIPGGVKFIGDSAFQSCKALTSIAIPKGVVSIERNAFQSCVSLVSVVVPDGMTKIEKLAFCKCASLRRVVIPNSLVSIGNHAFSSCNLLVELTYEGTKKQWGQIKKGKAWKGKIKYVKCTDGTIEL